MELEKSEEGKSPIPYCSEVLSEVVEKIQSAESSEQSQKLRVESGEPRGCINSAKKSVLYSLVFRADNLTSKNFSSFALWLAELVPVPRWFKLVGDQ